MNRIRQRRATLGMTQQQLAEHLQTTQQTIARWEAGKTDIPMSQLVELALCLECSVDELLGIERKPESWKSSPYAVVDHDVPYGTLRLMVAGAKRDYPIGDKTREAVLGQLEKLGFRSAESRSQWLAFATLNNKLVFANPGHISDLSLIGVDVDAMPSFEHPEVYRALDEWPEPDHELGSTLAEKIEAMVREHGEDDLMQAVSSTQVVLSDGRAFWVYLDEETAPGISELDGHRYHVPQNTFLIVMSDDPYQKRAVNLSSAALLEVPLERYLRLTAPAQ